MGMGLTLLLAFGLPPVLQLAQVPPLRVMRRDLGALKPASWLVLGVGVTGFAALLMVASRDIKLGLIAVGGFAVAVLLFAGLAWLAVKLLRQVVNEARRRAGWSWPRARSRPNPCMPWCRSARWPWGCWPWCCWCCCAPI
jgi:predicted lysophospholipase L1 biosynthesis ABC-type transport system permease subunit